MTDYGTIKIPRDEYEQHNKERQRAGLSWADYIDGQRPDDPEDTVEVDESAIASSVTDDLLAQLPRAIAEELQ